ncbi:ribonuclease Z [Halobacterium hubeiense]|jgi:ribonuclease Z|uniref:Ribonuclease Z n=1 Tax=Halobacterium hubeiense TaxID=1407499 RepID=A0A0U5HXD1_9EURY|nr:ribonuclease Z [Halobacterium hubeiense]CQH61970.1 ribonuclease Z [Halobacterium hubeiense]
MTLQATFLGTSGAVPTTERNPSSVFVRRGGDAFLFDAGEATQRQMMRYGTGFDVSDVFVTHAHGDHVFGLPGLVQTWDFNDREDPLTIHVPRGVRDQIEALVFAVGGDVGFPVRVSEVSAGETVLDRPEYEVRAFDTAHRTTSVGYALVEDDRKGRFDREKAEELGVPVGPKFSKLHDGTAVELEDGTVVRPEQVVGDPRPGRKLVYTGDTRPHDPVVAAADGADLLIHDATFTDDAADRAEDTGHSTAGEAAEIAARADARALALTHVSSRYAGDARELREDAEAADFDGEVFVAHDGMTYDVPFPDAD